MSRKKLLMLILIVGSVFATFLTLILAFSSTVKEYAAVVSSISTFFYLTFNMIIVYININSLNNNIRPFVIVAFETFDDGKGCFTLKNVGNSAAIIKSVEIDKKWLEKYFDYFPDLPESEKKFMRELKATHIILSPKTKLILKMKFDPVTVINAQITNHVDVLLKFTNASNQKFNKRMRFDFTQYSELFEYESSDVAHKGIATGEVVE